MSFVAIATAAIEMLGGDTAVKMSRKPEIMADAAYHILTQDSRSLTGKFLIDDEVMRESGVTDLDQYANAPGERGHVCFGPKHNNNYMYWANTNSLSIC